MGYGSVLAEVPFGPEILREKSRTTVFMAPIENQKFKLFFYANGESPVAVNLVFPGAVLPAAPPYGGTLDTSLPLVPTLPEGPDAAIVKLTSTIGPAGITYYEYSRGRFIPYHPSGILLPRDCPSHGFQFAASFEFADSTSTTSTATVPCPATRALHRRSRHIRHRG
jgi:hypothetical protein